MKEAFLHYIWQYQQFQHQDLLTTGGEKLIVVKTGTLNSNAGPDFLEAKISIGAINWSGAVEIHVKGSDWNTHQHQHDPKYRNVILHVVWEHDVPIYYEDESPIPTIVLKNKVALHLVEYYKVLMDNKQVIACSGSWNQINSLVKMQMLESSLVERLAMKTSKARIFYEEHAHDWEATTYFMLLSAFGFKVNAHGFERLAHLLPYELVKRYRSQPEALYALFYGVAGFLEEGTAEEQEKKALQNEWKYLQHKHQIDSILSRHEWNFLRLRPANFPTVRLAQAVETILSVSNLFEEFGLKLNVKLLKQKLEKIEVKNLFFAKGKRAGIRLGKHSTEILILNVSPPIMSQYARMVDDNSFMEKALTVMEDMKAEDNKVTRIFEELGEHPKSAFESQALLQLYSTYCLPKKCLNCKIGLAIMKRAS